MRRTRSKLLVIAIFLLLASAAFFLAWGVNTRSTRALKYKDILGLPAVQGTYHSINNWQTEEDTDFTGVRLYELLENSGVTDAAAQIRIIAPDGYFWPAVGTTLELEDLRQPNAQGLYTLLAYELNGTEMQPEPEGSGPLRLVMPQYEGGQVNKPSWVSNVRLIEVGPLGEGFQAPDAASVPPDEVWLYGNLPTYHSFPVWPALACLAAGLLLSALLLLKRLKRGAAISMMVLLLVASSIFILGVPCMAGGQMKTFSLAELQAMPSFSGHYTFLKSQEPYTYYEADYSGIPLSYLLDQAMTLGANAAGVTVRARDGYKVNLTLDQVRKTYPGGLKLIVAYAKDGKPLEGEEGPLRLIVPQENPGNKDQGGDANTPVCERMVFSIEVAPLPRGMVAPATSAVPEGSLAIYGTVSIPAPSQPGTTPGGSTGDKTGDSSPATNTQPQNSTSQASKAQLLSRIELLKSPPWGNLFMVMWVFGGASWIYSIPYLELEIRTAGTR